MQQIGTSTYTLNDHLITYPSITVCKLQLDLVFIDGGKHLIVPQSPDLNEFLCMISVTRPDKSHEITILNNTAENRDVNLYHFKR